MPREQNILVGTRVRFLYGPRRVEGSIKEDRGAIGKGGRRLYLIAFTPDAGSPAETFIELPAEEFEVVEKVGSIGGVDAL